MPRVHTVARSLLRAVVPVAVVTGTLCGGVVRHAEANHCTSTTNCWRLFPGPHPAADKGWIWVCEWGDGWHYACYQAKITLEMVRGDFANCREAQRWVKATTVSEIEIRFKVLANNQRINENPHGTYVAEVDVSFEFDPAASTLRFTEISWPNMTNAEKSAVGAFNYTVFNHETGHATFGQAVLATRYNRTVASLPSPDPDAALSSLDRAVQANIFQAQQTLDQEAGEGGRYDIVTDHGRRQKKAPKNMPSGPNLGLACPGSP